MSKHEQYEELCTLALIGEVTAAEMHDLRQHLSECAACREQYREFTQFLLPQLCISSDNDASFETRYTNADRQRLRTEFLAAAQRQGRIFSQEALISEVSAAGARPALVRIPRSISPYWWAVAASVAAMLLTGGSAIHWALVKRERATAHEVARAAAPPVSAAPRTNDVVDVTAKLRAINEADAKTIAALEQQLSGAVGELQEAQRSLKLSQASQSALQEELGQKSSQLASLQSQVQGGAQNAEDLRTQVAQLQQRVNDGQGTAAADELRIHDLSDQLNEQSVSLNRERQMLSVGRDVRDLMGARSLHIIDVHDANGAGRDKKSFGRIFYTEGKSLIFYAFDLDEKKLANAAYAYQAWGERLGQPSTVKSLGVLYADDKAQRRWSLKVDDPHQLAEINSVFVTLEPHAGDGRPQGKRILFAFLGGEANHP